MARDEIVGTADERARYSMTTASTADARRDELVERLFGSALGATDLLCVYVGDRLGLYGSLADTGSTSAELASVAGVSERYVCEWLEQQALAGSLRRSTLRRRTRNAATPCRRATTRSCSTGRDARSDRVRAPIVRDLVSSGIADEGVRSSND
jgi:hypothetical protein